MAPGDNCGDGRGYSGFSQSQDYQLIFFLLNSQASVRGTFPYPPCGWAKNTVNIKFHIYSLTWVGYMYILKIEREWGRVSESESVIWKMT